MKNLVVGILAHVDAGKTTLSEAILYKTGVIKNLGRVDNKNSYFDHDEMERKRGITIFSKQAEFNINAAFFTMLDTPGHVDFSAEMERTLQVLDYAILVISASDGVQGHTKTLWRLLKQNKIPAFIFVNKMDQPDNEKKNILAHIRKELSVNIFDFSSNELSEEELEHMAVLYADYKENENILNEFLESGSLSSEIIGELISERQIYPCYFGSALKLEGVDEFIKGLEVYTVSKWEDKTDSEFGGRVFKITRDSKGSREVHIKITSGNLKVRQQIGEEKINQIRIYNGDKYTAVDGVYAGQVCTVTGLENIRAGQSVGIDESVYMQLLEPVLTYQLSAPEGISNRQIYPKLRLLEEEMTELSLLWDESNEEIKVKLMGQVQIEILREVIKNRFGFVPEFGLGSITYKETIKNSVIGVGHFEPLRHYAEVHLLLEPGEPGSGITVFSNVSEDILDKNWQRLIKTHILERSHRGVLTGAVLTDVKITIINGRAHQKHTEGGDFRQATYRAIRNGLMQADSQLLEPYYYFSLIIPSDMVGRAMTDIENMHGTLDAPDISGDTAILTGKCPVYTMRDYQVNVNSYTRGKGDLTLSFCGYDVCHNQETIVEEKGYNPDEDIRNPSSSVFCAHGAGFIVPWYEVKDYMHVFDDKKQEEDTLKPKIINGKDFDYSIGTDEIDEILARTYSSNYKSGKHGYKKKTATESYYASSSKKTSIKKDKLLVVDGYNVIFAWEDLKELARTNIEAAKDSLIMTLSDYQGIVGYNIILVFDGYKAKNNPGSSEESQGITIVHTKEGVTADAYIEKYTNEHTDKYNITVATSDGLIQQITWGQNCRVCSSRELYGEIQEAKKLLRETYNLD